MGMADVFGLISVVITSVVGPLIILKQKSTEKKANATADFHMSHSQALSALVGAVESLHSKIDGLSSRPCAGSREASDALGNILHAMQSDIAVLKDRSHR